MTAAKKVETVTTFEEVGSISGADAVRAQLKKIFLARMVGRVSGGSGAADRAVPLAAAYDVFPTADDKFKVPSISFAEISSEEEDDTDAIDASYTEDNDGEGHAFERSEASGEMQVDIWATDPVERKALKAAFRAVFRKAVRELGIVAIERGLSMTIELPCESLPPILRGAAGTRTLAHVSVDEPPHDIDDGGSAMRSEWRATARITWHAQVGHAIDAERMDVVTQSGGVVEPGALTEALEA